MQQNFHRESVNYFWSPIGSLLFCAGLNLFIVPVGLYNGGTVGISQIIRTCSSPGWHCPPALTSPVSSI